MDNPSLASLTMRSFPVANPPKHRFHYDPKYDGHQCNRTLKGNTENKHYKYCAGKAYYGRHVKAD